MAKTSFMQNSFLGGEYSPLSQGQSNTEEYYSGMNLCLNYIPTDEGALARRPGFRFSAEARAVKVKLIPFYTADGSSYVCELTSGRLRFHTAGQLYYTGAVEVASISTATPAVVETSEAHGWSTGDTVIFPEAYLGPETAQYVFNRQFKITVLSSTTFSIAHTGSLGTGSVDGTNLGAALLAGEKVARVKEVTVPYLAALVNDVKYTEEGDNLYLFHADHEPNVLNGETLALTEAAFEDGPYLDLNETATTLAFSGTSGSVTVTASASLFASTDVGRLIRVNTGTETEPDWSWLKITAYSSATSVTATVRGENLASGSATTLWRLGVFSNTTGWPTHGVIHEGRLWLISDAFPGRVDGSKVFDFFNFEPTSQDGTVADDNGVSATVAGLGRKNFRWLQVNESGLLAGAESGEWLIRASALDDPITPFTIQIRQVTNYGSADALPVRAGRNTLFVQALGRALIEHRQEGGGFDGADLARKGRHLTPEGIVELAYSKVPVPIVWARLSDQRLIAVSYRNDLEGKQAAWHRHNPAWADDPYDATSLAAGRHVFSNETGPVLSIAAAPFSDASASRNETLWMAVLRNGQACVEYLMPTFDDTMEQNEAFHVDSGNIYTQEKFGITWVLQDEATNTYRFYGLDRLVGDSVDNLFRGGDAGSATVASGGYVDFSISDELQSTAAATITTSTLVGTLTFDSGFLSDTYEGSTGSRFPQNSNAALLIGEDGKRYVVKDNGVSNANAITFWDVDNGTDGPHRSVTDVFNDVDAADGGAEPGGSWNGTGGGAAFAPLIIPGTPYFLIISGTASGVTVDRFIAYYKINSSSAFELVGVYATGDDGLGVQFSTDKIFGMGAHLVSGATAEAYMDTPIIIATDGENRDTIVALPSINYVLQNTPIVLSVSGGWLARENDLAAFNSALENAFYLVGHSDNWARTFFLPASEQGGTRCYLLWHPADIAEHIAATASPTCSFLSTYASTYSDGFISSVRITGTDDAATALSDLEVSANDRFIGVSYPFPDIGEDYSGSSSTATTNFYVGASVFPVDEDDASGDWYCFFPRIYNDATDLDKFGIRVFKFSPRTQLFTHLDFVKGKLFDHSTDGVTTGIETKTAAIYWDRSNGDLIVSLFGVDSTESHIVVAKFGTFDETTETIVADAHLDAAIGLNYYSRGQILRPDLNGGAQAGPGLGKIRRTDSFNGLFYRTGQIKFGTKFTDFINLVLNEPDAVGRRPLYSGVSAIRALQDTYSYDSMMAWEQSRPDPGGIVSLAGHISTQDR